MFWPFSIGSPGMPSRNKHCVVQVQHHARVVRLATRMQVLHLRLDRLLARIEVLHADQPQPQSSGIGPTEVEALEHLRPGTHRVAAAGRVSVLSGIEPEDADYDP